MFYIYVLRSKSFGQHYIGSTENVEKRLEVHNGSRAKWTKHFQPWELIHQEGFGTRAEAMRRERELKAMKNVGRYLDSLRVVSK